MIMIKKYYCENKEAERRINARLKLDQVFIRVILLSDGPLIDNSCCDGGRKCDDDDVNAG